MSIKINQKAFEVIVDGKPVRFAPREFDTLLCLVKARGNVLSRHEILRQGWGVINIIDCDKDPRTIDQHIARIRRKLGKHKHRLIAVFRRGYRLKNS